MPERKAMPVHHTPTVTADWDGASMVARIPDDAGESVLRRMFAWQDPAGDPTAKSSYKLPHHMVSESGEVGAANMRACSAAMAALNGARGGVDIPDGDRRAVWNHIAAHMRDADMEPPEMMGARRLPAIERRCVPVEVRLDEPEEGKPLRMVGHAAMFDALSEELGFFREIIRPGAFTKTIREADVRALWNHEPIYPLGRTKAGTLRLMEDEKGLLIEIDPPDTSYARDLIVSMRRGDVDQMSFGFRTVKESWEGTVEAPIRVLHEVELFDVSPVTFPAYPQTEIGLRAYQMYRASYEAAFPQAGEPERTLHSAAETERRLAYMRRRLALAERMAR